MYVQTWQICHLVGSRFRAVAFYEVSYPGHSPPVKGHHAAVLDIWETTASLGMLGESSSTVQLTHGEETAHPRRVEFPILTDFLYGLTLQYPDCYYHTLDVQQSRCQSPCLSLPTSFSPPGFLSRPPSPTSLMTVTAHCFSPALIDISLSSMKQSLFPTSSFGTYGQHFSAEESSQQESPFLAT